MIVGEVAVGAQNWPLFSGWWDGSRWKTARVPSPAGENSLVSVSCASSQMCLAVGDGTGTGTFLVAWNGTSWVDAPPANPKNATAAIYTVICSSNTSCLGIGGLPSTPSQFLIEVWNGSKWRIDTLSDLPAEASETVSSESCSEASFCAAVGELEPSGEQSIQPIILEYIGSNWTRQVTPLPPNALGGGLLSVSCFSPNRCVAVGQQVDPKGNNQYVLIEQLENGKWSAARAPSIAGLLYGVSCTSTNYCVTVGTRSDSRPNRTLAEVWSGTSWIVQPTPDSNNPSGDGFMNVSCANQSSCMAIGYAGDPTAATPATTPLAARWNGKSWKIQRLPNPPH